MFHSLQQLVSNCTETEGSWILKDEATLSKHIIGDLTLLTIIALIHLESDAN